MKDQRIAILFAGQGAQTIGMGQDLAAKSPAPMKSSAVRSAPSPSPARTRN
jgi:malonyl CoA-acyl carrier protein transacylase